MGTKVTIRQTMAIEALLEGRSVTTTAEVVGVSRKTVYAWLKHPTFTEALESATQQAIKELSRKLVGLGAKAVSTLDQAMDDPLPNNLGTRVRAAIGVLDRILTLRELVDLENRIKRLEDLQNESTKTAI
jgi:hypothetical protein